MLGYTREITMISWKIVMRCHRKRLLLNFGQVVDEELSQKSERCGVQQLQNDNRKTLSTDALCRNLKNRRICHRQIIESGSQKQYYVNSS